MDWFKGETLQFGRALLLVGAFVALSLLVYFAYSFIRMKLEDRRRIARIRKLPIIKRAPLRNQEPISEAPQTKAKGTAAHHPANSATIPSIREGIQRVSPTQPSPQQKPLTPSQRKARITIGLGVLGSLVIIGLFFALWHLGFVPLSPRFPRLVPVVGWFIGISVLGVLVFAWVSIYETISEARKADERQVARETGTRAPLREEIRWWCAHLEDEYAWLLATAWEEQQKWAIRRFVEVVKDWKDENGKFSTMRRNESFEMAVSEVGEPAVRMLAIWEARRKLYQWARVNVTPVERVQSNLDTQEQIKQSQVEKVQNRERFKEGKQLGAGDDDQDDEDEAL